MKRTWSDNEVKILRKYYSVSTRAELNVLIPKHTARSIKTKALKLGLKKKSETMKRIRRSYNQNWTFEMDMFVIENYKLMTYNELAVKLGIGKPMLTNRIYKLGLKKGTNPSKFKKGHVPFNKGLKWDEYISEKGKINCLKTTFKQGHMPNNHRKVGSIRLAVTGYWYIKTAEPKTWEQLHHIIYKQHNPDFRFEKDVILEFKDGNPNNLSIDNIIKTTKQESMKRAKNSDKMIANYITRDKKLRAKIIREHPELVEIKRKIIELNKSLNIYTNE